MSSHAVATERWTPTKAGMLCFLTSEVAFFGTLIVTYAYYLAAIRSSSPGPAQVFSWPVVLIGTACLLTSSGTVHLAEGALRRGARGSFLALWLVTILLGIGFLGATAYEWTDLIGTHGLTISRNIFGTCYFTLVGFHAAHVTIGVIILTIVWMLGLRGAISEKNAVPAELVSWYWHFVDGVWIVVLTLVYVVGR